MKLDEIKELIRILEGSKLKKLAYKKGDEEISLEKEDAYAPMPQVARHPPHEMSHQSTEHIVVKGGQKQEMSGTFVTSPMVGTFYASPAPDQPSFVKVGDKVSPNTIVCIIEAMKVMNEVKAGVSGTVAEVFLESGQPVEFGSRLLRIHS